MPHSTVRLVDKLSVVHLASSVVAIASVIAQISGKFCESLVKTQQNFQRMLTKILILEKLKGPNAVDMEIRK